MSCAVIATRCPDGANSAFENIVGMNIFADAIELARCIGRAEPDDGHFFGMKLPEAR